MNFEVIKIQINPNQINLDSVFKCSKLRHLEITVKKMV